jgi:hypothetical protein
MKIPANLVPIFLNSSFVDPDARRTEFDAGNIGAILGVPLTQWDQNAILIEDRLEIGWLAATFKDGNLLR